MEDLRKVMATFATGVTVLTVGGGAPQGMTANAFCSVSLDPPLVLCCVTRTARLHEALSTEGHFAVSILSSEQEDAARHFANRSRPHGREQFDSVPWIPGPRTGAPLIAEALAWLECEVVERVVAGDHTVFIGRVTDAGTGDRRGALLFHAGVFHGLPGALEAPVRNGRVTGT